MLEGQIVYVAISALIVSGRNPRVHSKQQIRQILASMRRFGVNTVLIIDENNQVLAGHGRLEALKQLRHTEVACIRVCNLSDADKRAYQVADNKIHDNSTFELETLAIVLEEAGRLEIEPMALGFDQNEFDEIILSAHEAATVLKAGCTEDAGPLTASKAVSRLGDCWTLGRHSLLCCDARDVGEIGRLLGDRRAQVIFTDPPWNVPIEGHVSGLGAIHHREFAMACGEMSPEEFTEFLRSSFAAMVSVCCDGAIAYVCMDWRHIGEMMAAGKATFTEHKNVCVLNKTNAGNGAFYRSKHELVFVWKIGTAPHINNIGLGGGGKHRANVWTYAGSNAFGADRLEQLKSHPTPKPVAMIADAICDVTARGDVVLDPFAGSGSTLIAAHKTGRVAVLAELDPLYCDVIVRRFQKYTGEVATNAQTGQTFEDVDVSRNNNGWVVPQ